MDLKTYSKRWCEQSAYIHTGLQKQDESCLLTFKIGGGQGLLWDLEWRGEALTAWCDIHQWRAWVEEKIPHDDVEETDPALIEIVTRWCWDKVNEDLSRAQLHDISAPILGAIEKDLHPVLTLRDGSKNIEFVLPDWPVDLLKILTQGWGNKKDVIPHPHIKIRCPVILGWTTLSISDILKGGEGSVIFPSVFDMNTCYLQVNQNVVELSMDSNNEHSVVAIHQADEHVVVENKTVVASLKNLPVKVMVEIAHAEMTFDDIIKVKVGACLTLDMIPGAAIRLLVSGCIIGYGELVKLEDRVAVRITQLF